MKQIDRVARRPGRTMAAAAGILLAVAGAGHGAPAAPPASGTGTHDARALQARLDDVNAQIASARSTNSRLESQVAQVEQQNDARRKQLQDRDAQIAALQAKLQAAGAPASASSS